MPEDPLTGKVVLVTGGGRGIGRAHCLELASQGAALVVNDPGVGRDGSSGDGAGPAADMVSTAVATFGSLTGVVNNAGILRDSMVAASSEADWDAVITVHLKGTFAVTRHACDYWRAQSKAGNPIDAHIVNTVSGAGLWGNVGQSAYGAAKAIWPLARSRMTADVFAARADDPALDPARSSAVVAWLQSAQSSWLTGQILRVNGDKPTRIEGFTEAPGAYHAKDGTGLTFSEIGQAVSWLYGTSPRGLAGPLPTA